MHPSAEGWYQDPYRAHDERWFSAGRPTGLVRDSGVETTDPPPSQEYRGKLEEVARAEPRNFEGPKEERTNGDLGGDLTDRWLMGPSYLDSISPPPPPEP